jgi:hypothetical protein
MASPLGLRAPGSATERRGPPTVAQAQLLALDRRTPRPRVCNLSYAVGIEGPLDVAALADAFAGVVARHEPLRTTYEGDEAVVGEGDTVDLKPRPVQDLEEAAALAEAEREAGFDLSREGPLRASLLRLGEERHVLLLTLHHVAADGWTLRLLCEELSRRYAGEAVAAELDSDCIDHARWQREWLESPAAERELDWWRERLAGTSPRPAGEPRVELRRQVVVLPDALTAELRRFGREAVVSVFALLVTAFEVLVARWSEVDEPVVGTLAANRPTPQSARILGAHYNPLFLATDLGGDPTLAECVLRVGESTVRALDHQTLPYARLVQELGWDGTRVPAAMLLLDRYPVEELRLAGCRVEGLNLPGPSIPAATTAELSFFVREVGDRLTLSAFYAEGTLEDDLVLALAGGYVGILDAMTASPELALAEVDPFGEARPARPDGPGLYELSTVAPAEALSPVGRFDDW